MRLALSGSRDPVAARGTYVLSLHGICLPCKAQRHWAGQDAIGWRGLRSVPTSVMAACPRRVLRAAVSVSPQTS